MKIRRPRQADGAQPMGAALLNEIDKNRRYKVKPPDAELPEIVPRQFNQGAAMRPKPVSLAVTWGKDKVCRPFFAQRAVFEARSAKEASWR